jgi:hypothetical protein
MEKYRVQVNKRIHRLQVMSFLEPTLKRGLMIGEAPMRRAVVFGFEPGAEAQIQVIKPGDGFYVKRTQETIADRSVEPFDLATPLRPMRGGMNQMDLQDIQNALGLV